MDILKQESWYQELASPIKVFKGIVKKNKITGISFTRHYQYVLALAEGKELKLYTGSEIDPLERVIGKTVQLSGKLIDVSRLSGEEEFWPGEMEII